MTALGRHSSAPSSSLYFCVYGLKRLQYTKPEEPLTLPTHRSALRLCASQASSPFANESVLHRNPRLLITRQPPRSGTLMKRDRVGDAAVCVMGSSYSRWVGCLCVSACISGARPAVYQPGQVGPSISFFPSCSARVSLSSFEKSHIFLQGCYFFPGHVNVTLCVVACSPSLLSKSRAALSAP